MFHQLLLILCQLDRMRSKEVTIKELEAFRNYFLEHLIVAHTSRKSLFKVVYQSFPLKTDTFNTDELPPHITMELFPFNIKDIWNRLGLLFWVTGVKDIIWIILTGYVADHEVFLVTPIVILPHPSLLIFAEGTIVTFAIYLIDAAVHLHILPSVNDCIALQLINHASSRLFVAFTIIVKVVKDIGPCFPLLQHGNTGVVFCNSIDAYCRG